MAELVGNSIVESRYYTSVNGQTCINVFHWWYVGSTAPNYVLVMNAANTQWRGAAGAAAAILTAQAQNAILMYTDWQPIYPTRLAAVRYIIGDPGLQPTDALSPNIGATITKRSEFAKRWGIGSLHVAGLPGDDFAQGSLTAGAFARCQDIASKLPVPLDGLGTQTLKPILWNRPNPERRTLITTAATQNTARVMRRRTVGVGI